MKTWPTLYKTDSKGKIQQWDISVFYTSDNALEHATISVTHGRVGGALQTTEDIVKEGKNLGKVNSTTAFEQAVSEAESKWTKQQERKGYKLSPEAVDERPGEEPMLAHRYDQHPEKITFPAYVQPKLDGHRCLAVVENGRATLFSRKRTPITGVPHIIKALEEHFKGLEEKIVLDGELYNHSYHDRFEELTGFIRSQIPKPGHGVVEFHIYDIFSSDFPGAKTFEDRFSLLKSNFRIGHALESTVLSRLGCLVIVPTKFVENEDRAMEEFGEFRSQGYEGAMLRNRLGLYVGKRSYDLQKMKSFVDEEFVIVGVGEGRGKLAGHAIFQCKTPAGQLFDVKMKGATERLKAIFEDQKAYIGRQLTVSYQGMTSANSVPRFPVGLRLREDV